MDEVKETPKNHEDDSPETESAVVTPEPDNSVDIENSIEPEKQETEPVSDTKSEDTEPKLEYPVEETNTTSDIQDNGKSVEPTKTEADPVARTEEPAAAEPESVPELEETTKTEPEVTEPEVTEPEVAEPEVAEPEVSEAEVTEPEVIEADPATESKDVTTAVPVESDAVESEIVESKPAESKPITESVNIPEEPTAENAPPVPEKDTIPTKKKTKKLVGFAEEPEDLKEHHKFLEDRRKEKIQSNPFWKIPPELSYLEKQKEGPKPLPSFIKKKILGTKSIDDMKDLPTRAVKEISVINKDTALNFFYHEIDIPVGPDRILVDVKYASLSSLDIEKLNKYKLNLSVVRVGLGYDYVGEIIAVGKKFQNHPEYLVGTLVFGVVHPLDKKGSLQTLLIVNPKDIIIPISQDQVETMSKAMVKLTFDKPKSFLVEDDESELEQPDADPEEGAKPPILPPKQEPYAVLFELAKFCTFSTMYCRAKQALSLMDLVFKMEGTANIIINGADTNLGYTIAQTIASSVYQDILQSFNVILVIQDANLEKVKRFVEGLNSGGTKNFHILPFDMQNEDIVLPKEKVPVNYKKPLFFAAELLQLMFKAVPDSEEILKTNVDRVKIDLFIDIVGSKKMFQRNLEMQVLDDTHFPFKERLAPGTKALSLFGKAKEPLFTKILRPKNAGSTFVSYCDFAVRVPTYSVDKQVSSNQGIFNPWGLRWSSGLANQFVAKYNYYTLFDLEVKESWAKEALGLVLANELRVKIDHVVDWRNNFRQYIERMREHDGQTVFRVESF